MLNVVIYTDGACSKNPGVGGWATILMFGEHRRELSGAELLTTNNRMELMAAIKALKALKMPCNVELYSDSAYLCNAFNELWLLNWKRNGWLTKNKKPVENQDLWQELLRLTDIHNVKWLKVKGHADNEFNNRCDELARGEIKRLQSEQST